MRLLSLDFDPVYGDDATRASFGSDVSAFDYDAVIWDPGSHLGDYHAYQTYMGLPLLTDDSSVRFQADIKRRRAEFLEFLNSGRTLIVIARPELAAYCHTGEVTYSGTGRNAVPKKTVTKLAIQTAIPASGLSFVPARGERIQGLGEGPLQSLIRKYISAFTYRAVITGGPGKPIASVSGTDRVVATLITMQSGGALILLPHIELRDLTKIEDQPERGETADDDDESDDYIENAPNFQVDLLAGVEALNGIKTLSRPAWSHRFATAGQLKLREEVLESQKAVEEARSKLAIAQQLADQGEAQDQLFLGTGRALELEVRNVLEMLGGEVHEPEPGRDDWRVTFPEGKAVVEVKGVGKSAAEKHAAQLEKWVSASYEETGELHKGVLIVNTWRDMPLDERTQPDFPEQMIGYSTSRNHTLLTGLQLFVMWQRIENGEVSAEECRKLLFETCGPMQGCEDWEKYLLQVSPQAENK